MEYLVENQTDQEKYIQNFMQKQGLEIVIGKLV